MNVLVTFEIGPEAREFLESQLGADHLRFTRTPSESDLAEATVIFGNLPNDTLQRATTIGWIHSPNVGLDDYPVEGRRAGLEITNSSGVMDDAVPEHAIALLLALTRRLPALIVAQAKQEWSREAYTTSRASRVIAGKEAHVLGYGRIAKSLVRKLAGLGMRVIVYRRQGEGDDPLVQEFRPLSGLADGVATADVLIALLPATDGTRGLVSRAVIDALPPHALFINLGRGQLVDEDALTEALTAGRLGGAGLDVFREEPLSATSPLWALPNVIVTPHIGGRFDQEYIQHARQFVERYHEKAASGREGKP